MKTFFSTFKLLCVWFLITNVAAAREPLAIVSVSGERRLDGYAVGEEGQLTPRFQVPIDASPGTSRFDLTGRFLFVGCSNPPSIQAFRVTSDGLQHLQSADVPAKPSYLHVTPSGQFLLASYYSTGQVTVHRIISEGRFSSEPVQTLTVAPRAHAVVTDLSGKFVFVPHTSANRISQFHFDDVNGLLTPNAPPALLRDEGTGPRHLEFHPEGRYAFGSDEQGRSVSVYALDEQQGVLRVQQTLPSMPKDAEGKKLSTSHIEVHKTGKYVYIANRGHGTIAVFQFDATSGKLALIQEMTTEKIVRSFNLSPDGNVLLAAGQKSGQLVCYRVGEDGKLTETDRADVGKTPWWVSFAPVLNHVRRDRDATAPPADRTIAFGQGAIVGEVSDTTALLQTRVTLGTELDDQGGLPGGGGEVRFLFWEDGAKGPEAAQATPPMKADPSRDSIVRFALQDLRPDTVYRYRGEVTDDTGAVHVGPEGTFQTLPGQDATREVAFIVGSCMNYMKFMYGREGNAGGPITATDEDKRLGFPAFATMKRLRPEFFVGTGDIVYYDNPLRVAKTVEELRRCWQEQFRFPRMQAFFAQTPTYWSKDDHDFRYNDSDNESDRTPSAKTGIDMFHEQLPIAAFDTPDRKSYRTIRVSQHLQLWLTEGRDYRSPNTAPDGPEKSMWGPEQRQWLKSTLVDSDATWKVIVSPTPIVGPDDAYKNDNHANLAGFRHEADAFFAWIQENDIDNLVLVCGDRHWQYHSIHSTGVHEFSCGALNDENARMGVPPGAEFGSDPEGTIQQPYTSPEPSGGFLHVTAGERLQMTHYSDDGDAMYTTSLPSND